MTIICNSDSAAKYPGTEKYIYDILHLCGLDSAKVLFFAPEERTMWVELPDRYVDVKPVSFSYLLSDENPRTDWSWDDDPHEGQRPADQIYTNTYLDKKNKCLAIVDKMNYGDTPAARVIIFQSRTKGIEKLGIYPDWMLTLSVTDMRHIEMLSNWIDSRRKVSFYNYRLGQEMKRRKELKNLVGELEEIIRSDQEPRNRITAAWREHPKDTLLHKAIAAEVLAADSINLIKTSSILDSVGFPRREDVGEANIALWLVIQHSPLEYQQRYIPLFKDAAMKGDLPKEAIAMMEDRIAIRSGRPQIYGSQGNLNEQGIFVPADMIDPANVDKRRAEMGMTPLADYISKMSAQ